MKHYFQAYKDYFWKWEDKGLVVAIPASFTIAYKDLIEESMEQLALQGLPPFGSLLLAILATNSKGKESIDAVYSLLSAQDENIQETIEKAIWFLKFMADIYTKYIDKKDRLLLFQTLFQDCHNILNTKKSQQLTTFFKSQNLAAYDVLTPIDYKEVQIQNDFRIFALLARKFPTVQSLLEAMAGLRNVPILSLIHI